MSRTLTIRQPQVKCTATGAVRFNLAADVQEVLRNWLLGWANQPKAQQLGSWEAFQMEANRRLAQELIIRPALLRTMAHDNRFLLKPQEAYQLLAMLWEDVMTETGYLGGTTLNWLMNDLHKLLS